jgi:hypothetical protein
LGFDATRDQGAYVCTDPEYCPWTSTPDINTIFCSIDPATCRPSEKEPLCRSLFCVLASMPAMPLLCGPYSTNCPLKTFNGNILPGYSDQDYECSSVASPLNGNPFTKMCCVSHDECFAKYKCNASSFGGTKIFNEACTQCDDAVRECVTRNLVRYPF